MPRISTRKAPRKSRVPHKNYENPMEPEHVKTRADFVRFLKQLYQSKKRDDARVHAHHKQVEDTSTQKKATEKIDKLWKSLTLAEKNALRKRIQMEACIHKLTSAHVPYDERWAHDHVKGFLEAMLNGAGYEPECPYDNSSTRSMPRNPWTYCATLFEYGRIYE